MLLLSIHHHVEEVVLDIVVVVAENKDGHGSGSKSREREDCEDDSEVRA